MEAWDYHSGFHCSLQVSSAHLPVKSKVIAIGIVCFLSGNRETGGTGNANMA